MSVIDPGVQIPILSDKNQTPIKSGRSSVPYSVVWDDFPRIKKDDQKEYLHYPCFPVETNPETIVNGATIPLFHNLPNFNPDNWHLVQPWVLCSVGELGYQPNETTTISHGVSLQVSATEILCNIQTTGIEIVRKDGDRNIGICNVANWSIFAKGFFFVPSLEI